MVRLRTRLVGERGDERGAPRNRVAGRIFQGLSSNRSPMPGVW